MTVRKGQGKTQTRRKMDMESNTGVGGRIITALLLYAVALLSLYVTLAVPEKNTAMGAIRDTLLGAGGSLAVLIPVFLAYVATLLLLRARGGGPSAWKGILYGLLFPLTHTLTQLFCTEDIIANRMTIQTWANYLKKAYSYGKGGGFIGGILAWPVYRALGMVGGVLVIILSMLLILVATGALGALAGVVTRRVERTMDIKEERKIDRELFEPEKKSGRRQETDDVPWETRRKKNEDRGMILPDRTRVRKSNEAATARENGRVQPERKTASDLDTAKPRKKMSEPERARDGETGRRVSKQAERPRRNGSDVPDYLREDAAATKDTSKARAGRPRQAQKQVADDLSAKKASKKKAMEEAPTFDPGKARAQKAEEGQLSIPDDLTIEPDYSEVISGDDGATAKPVRGKLKRPTHVAKELAEEYNYPPIDLLPQGDGAMANSREEDLRKAELLEETLEEFGIKTKLTGIAHGPSVTRFELQPAPGVKVSRITSLTDDITLHLAAPSVRIEAPIPGKAAVGVEVPNDVRETVRLRDVLESQEARKSNSRIAVGLGKDNSGRYIVADIAKMPHVLIAGQTGAGKSVCINALIISILFRAAPEEVKLIMIDPKVVELSVYNDIPHLVCPVVTDCQKAASALDWAVAEMETRYRKFAERNVRDIKGYNKALADGEEIMPQMVIIIDELADLMMAAPGEVEDSIQRLAQKARAAGIHLVIATQRPSVNVVTGVIKANIPSRIAFSVSSQVDSRTIIDHAGAEKLLGNGDMLFAPSGINKPMRVQGAWVSDEEVNAIVTYIKERSEVNYNSDMVEKLENSVRSDAEKEEISTEYDPRLPEAVEIVVEAGQASVSMLQRRMRVGYARAGRLIDEMEKRGIVSSADGAKPRTVLINREELEAMFEEDDAT